MNTQKLYKWTSNPIFNGQSLSGYVWASSEKSAIRKVKNLKESPCSGLSNANITVEKTLPPNGIYYAIGYSPKKSNTKYQTIRNTKNRCGVKACWVCGKLTNLQLTACFPFGRPGNMIHESRPAHKECVKDKFGKWSFIKPENKNSGV